MSWWRATLAVVLVVGCVKVVPPLVATAAREDLLATFRAREVPARTVARFQIQLQTEARTITLPGAWVVDRPARGHVALLGPLGGPLATLQSDGVGLSVALSRGQQHFLAERADAVLRDTTGGALGVSDLFGLLVGDPPLDGAPALAVRSLPDGDVQIDLDGPADTVVSEVVANPAGTLARLVATGADGEVQLTVDYAPFAPITEGGPLVPTELTVTIPALKLVANVRVKSWTAPEVVPDVFSLASPPGFTTAPFETLVDPLGSLEGTPNE